MTTEFEETKKQGHELHQKHLQLGVDPSDVQGDNRHYVTDPAKRDDIWADATTVEQFEADIQELQGEDPEILEQLRQAANRG